MRFATLAATCGVALGLLGVCAPVRAEVIEESDSGFITKAEAYVAASPKETWLALISPAGWWSSEHTWSADAANLRLTPQAGGCFCEKIPEVVTPDSFTLEGSVEHMRVIQAYPERALRMVGALGPLQSEPVTGVLTIVLTEVETPEGPGTRIVWEYNVGGSMRYEIPVISTAVDGVMNLQLAGLSEKLGVIEMPEEEVPEESGPSGDEETGPEGKTGPDSPDDEASAPVETEEAPRKEDEEGKDDEPRSPSVDEAFDDLADPKEEPPSALL